MKSLCLAWRGPFALQHEGPNCASFWGCVPALGARGGEGRLVGVHITLKNNFVSLARCLLCCCFVTVLWIIGLKPRLMRELLNHKALKRRLGWRAFLESTLVLLRPAIFDRQSQKLNRVGRKRFVRGQLRRQLKNASPVYWAKLNVMWFVDITFMWLKRPKTVNIRWIIDTQPRSGNYFLSKTT